MSLQEPNQVAKQGPHIESVGSVSRSPSSANVLMPASSAAGGVSANNGVQRQRTAVPSNTSLTSLDSLTSVSSSSTIKGSTYVKTANSKNTAKPLVNLLGSSNIQPSHSNTSSNAVSSLISSSSSSSSSSFKIGNPNDSDPISSVAASKKMSSDLAKMESIISKTNIINGNLGASYSASDPSTVQKAPAPIGGSVSPPPVDKAAKIAPMTSNPMADLLGSKNWLLSNNLTDSNIAPRIITVKKETSQPLIKKEFSENHIPPKLSDTTNTLYVKSETGLKIPAASNDFSVYKNLAAASTFLNIKPTTLGPSSQPKIAPAKLLPSILPNTRPAAPPIVPKPPGLASKNNGKSAKPNDTAKHLTLNNIVSHNSTLEKKPVKQEAAKVLGATAMQRSASSNSSVMSHPKDPAEMKFILNSKVKENEKLKIIIDKLRNEINMLKVLQDKECVKNELTNVDNKDKTPLNDTINPMKLSNNITNENNSSSILRDLDTLLMENTAKKNSVSGKRRKEGRSNKRQHLNTDSPNIQNNLGTDMKKKTSISSSMLNLSLIDGGLVHSDDNHNDIDDGVLDERLAGRLEDRLSSCSPSPSLSLTTSNNSEMAELDIDSILLMNSLSSLSPVSTMNSSPDLYNDTSTNLNHVQKNEDITHTNDNKTIDQHANLVLHYLNTNTHQDPNTLKKLLLSNTSVKLERSRSLNSYNDNNLTVDYYHDLALKLGNQVKKQSTKQSKKSVKQPVVAKKQNTKPDDDRMDVDHPENAFMKNDPSLPSLSSVEKNSVFKDLEQFLEYDPVSDDTQLPGAIDTIMSSGDLNLGSELFLDYASFDNFLGTANGESKEIFNPAINELKSLKLERSFSVPTYSEPSKVKSKKTTNKKVTPVRSIKRPTKHFTKNSPNTPVKPNIKPTEVANSKSFAAARKSNPDFEPCGFCVEGTPCPCIEAALELSDSHTQPTDNSSKMDVDTPANQTKAKGKRGKTPLNNLESKVKIEIEN